MGDRRIFLKSLRDTSFNKDLSNEPTFGRIHLTGQYLLIFISGLIFSGNKAGFWLWKAEKTKQS